MFTCGAVMMVPTLFLSSSTVEHSAVNRRVVGSNPTWGAKFIIDLRAKSPSQKAVFSATVGTFVGMLFEYGAHAIAIGGKVPCITVPLNS